MSASDPEHWFVAPKPGSSQKAFTTGNSVEAFVDGRGYFADLKGVLAACDRSLLIAGWRVSGEQLLDPAVNNGSLHGETFIDSVAKVRRNGADIKALLFNVPGTDMPGPFRFWHAQDNRDFCDALLAIGGDAILDSRISHVPASSHHQKFIVSLASDHAQSTAYLGGIDVCYDRWDQPPHDQAPERQRDFVRGGGLETHQPSQPGWHDIQIKIQGPAIAQIWEVFRNRWNDPRAPNRDPFLTAYRGLTKIDEPTPEFSGGGSMAVQINLTLPEGIFPEDGGAGEQSIARAHEHAIDQAQHYIYVEDQYVWPCSLVERLEEAIKRGVRVLMIVARDYDAPGLAVFSRRLRSEVINRLRAAAPDRFKIHHLERTNGEQIYVHSKLFIIDDQFVSVGSANFNARSLLNDTEIQAGIVDTATIETMMGGQPQSSAQFAHDLRCRLWAEHLEVDADAVHDPIAAFDELWVNAPLAPSRRAVPHVVKEGFLHVDAVAEYITTLITKRMAAVPLIELPPGVTERSAVKLAVDSALRGPLAAGVIKFMEEMLNPDTTTTLAAVERAIQKLNPFASHSPMVHAQSASGGNVASHGIQVTEEHRAEAAGIIRKLRRKQLPRMVDWTDPLLLAAVGVRTIISSTIGQYADQRPMQAAMDECSPEEQRARHDYSTLTKTRLKMPANFGHERLKLDDQGRVWLDFIADLGDGFEATYAMAYLLASSQLDVRKGGGETLSLPAGEVLVFGGDLAYPNATVKEYTDRCLTPYDMAFRTDTPKRQLYYIAGNHDWYDGLTAFTSVFCTARDRYTQGLGKQIGGWRCHQRRSYFALKMPFDWQLWGVDLGLTDTIDDAQLDYFHTMSEATKPGDKIIIITHAPGWVNKNIDGIQAISMIARSRGAEVPAVLAGDLHHYSRYYSQEAGVHLITSGGGGAFAHATHQLKSRMKVGWAMKTDEKHRVSQGGDRPEFNREEREAVSDSGAVDFTEEKVTVSAGGRDHSIDTMRATPGRRPASAKEFLAELKDFVAPNFYPERWRSRLLVLRNLWLPFHNWRFAILLGLIYMIFGWIFQLSVADPIDQMRKTQYANADIACLGKLKIGATSQQMEQCKGEAYKLIDETIGKLKLSLPVDDAPKLSLPTTDLKPSELTAEKAKQAVQLIKVELETLWQALLLSVSPKRVLFGMLNNPAFFLMVLGLWWGLVHYVDAGWNSRVVNLVARLVLGSLHFLAHMALLLIITAVFDALIYQQYVDGKGDFWTILGGVSLYTVMMILFGGLLGGIVWGLYWSLTSALFGMHMDAFSALGIANYKNFLRMSFEPDRLTIYPIGLDKVPGRKGWRAPYAGERIPEHNPLILPKRPLAPKLIEEPIVIETRKRGQQ